jgi:tetratricopeptide (TPR) repeat protein
MYSLRPGGGVMFLIHPAICLMALLLFVPFDSTRAQGGGVQMSGTGGRHTIQGKIYFPSGRRADLIVKVTLESSNVGELSVFADTNGSFSFRNLSGGSYAVVINAGADYEIARESVYIDQISTRTIQGLDTVPRVITLPIYLQPKFRSDAEKKIGVVNAALANVPKAAADLYLRALEVARTGNSKKAIEDLKAALSQYPDFPLALTELGVQYLKISEPDKAADALATAVKLAPDDFPPRLNYGIALLNQRKFALAEEQFRAALQRTEAPTARMYLGITLAMQRKLTEAEKELLAAVKLNTAEVNLAHRYLGGVYIATREYKRAATELETYLKLAPKAADAERIRATIADLRNKP